MLNSKQRAYLRSIANKLEPIVQIGKGGVTPEVIKSLEEALEKRELIKCKILNNCMENPKYIISIISERTKADVVQVIGSKIVLFRKSKQNNLINLP